MKTMRMLIAVALLAAAFGIRADQPEKPPKGQGKYLIVLWEPGTPVPGKPDERMKRVPEPDIEKLGGRLLAKRANRRVVFLPYGAAKQLRKHEGVSIVQRIWTGEPFSEWNETNANLTELRNGEVSTDEDPTFTWDRSYSYDGAGNITNIGNDTFAYDDLDRLTQATVDGSSQTYSYDAFGNLTGMVTNGTSVSTPADPSSNRIIGQTYDVAGNVTSRSHGEYDASGNLIQRGHGTYVHDALNMLVQYEALPGNPGSARRILYDADDERIGMLIDYSLDRWTIRGLDGQILREFTGSGYDLTWGWEQDHIRGEGQLIAGESVVWGSPYGGSQLTWGGKRHYHLDHLGSVRIVTNQAGKSLSQNDFFPFGAARTRQTQEQINWGGDLHIDGMRFAGHWRAFLGHPGVESEDYLDYMHARYYDSNLGRFLSVDPVLGDPRQPQSWNRYTYVMNNPLKFTDPTGMMFFGVITVAPREDPSHPEGTTQSFTIEDFFRWWAESSDRHRNWLWNDRVLKNANDTRQRWGEAPYASWEECHADHQCIEMDEIPLMVGGQYNPTNAAKLAQKADNLIRGSLKASASYRSELGQKTYAQIIALSKGSGPEAQAAKAMKKLIEQSDRLLSKVRGK
jgi:RHS repeat-associated protein